MNPPHLSAEKADIYAYFREYTFNIFSKDAPFMPFFHPKIPPSKAEKSQQKTAKNRPKIPEIPAKLYLTKRDFRGII